MFLKRQIFVNNLGEEPTKKKTYTIIFIRNPDGQ